MISVLSQVCIFAAVVLALLALCRFYLAFLARFTENVRVSMEDLFLFIDPAVVLKVNLLLLVVLPGVVWVLTQAWPLVLIVALATALMPRVTYRLMRARRMQKIIDQMPDALAMVAGSLRAGASLQMALSMVVKESPAPLAQEFSMVLREQRLGMTLEDSLDGLSKRLQVEDIALFVSAMTIAKEVGGNLAEILDRLASTLRTKAAMEGKIRALTAQGKMQGWVVGLLPIVLGAVLYALEPEAMSPMFTTAYGWAVMATVATLLMLGRSLFAKSWPSTYECSPGHHCGRRGCRDVRGRLVGHFC